MIDFIIKVLTLLIAGLIALYQAKLNIVTNSRIKRIETLRELISDYVSAVTNLMTLKTYCFEDRKHLSSNINDMSENEKVEMDEKYVKPYDLSVIKIDKLNSKIILYLNNETEKKLQEIIFENIKLIGDTKKLNRTEVSSNLNLLVEKSAKIFRKELSKTNKFLCFKI
ncbi:hypothetical protein [Tenacibaculum aestuariivivum]|uniref:hypothetical protein n=1 Tax=Tenacibaculum aestuariivivum TaxID=2006131 RepID=UPI003AB16418